MNVERWLQITMAAMVTLGTFMLGISAAPGMGMGAISGGHGLLLSFVALLVAVSALYLTDIKGYVRFNTVTTNLAGVVVIIISFLEYSLQQDEESQLLALTNLLVYLQFVVMFQKKNNRAYWQLTMLSLLQVAVAAALNLNVLFAFMLLFYQALMLMALTLFYFRREALRCLAPERVEPAGPLERAVKWIFARGKRPETPPRRIWQMSAHPDQFVAVRNGLWQPVRPWRMWMQVGRMMLMTLPLVVAFFCLVPRIHRPSLETYAPGRTMVGFADHVKLGELGPIIERTEAVMRIRLSDKEGSAVRLIDDPLFRGSVLTEYSDGMWGRGKTHPVPGRWVQQRPDGVEPIDQEVMVQSRELTQILFAIFPVAIDQDNHRLSLLPERQQLVYNGNELPDRFTYHVTTFGIRDGRMSSITPCQEDFGRVNIPELLAMPDKSDESKLAGLRALASQVLSEYDIVQDSTDPKFDAEACGRALAAYLRNSGKFRYTLRMPKRDPTLDPVEDFVTKTPEGHCEYFASALALMLRSLGIPSRVVVGFRGNEYNSVGGYYQIRHLHAHAWVEMHLKSKEIPESIRGSGAGWSQGGWLILDATPASDDATATVITLLDRVKHLADYSQLLWATYVLDMDSKRQRDSIYDPLREFTHQYINQQQIQKNHPVLGKTLSRILGRNWFQWLVSAFMLGMLVVMFVSLWILRKFLARLLSRGWFSRRVKNSYRTPFVEFYARLERLLARYGLTRGAAQTQQEFAASVQGSLRQRNGGLTVAELPRSIVDAFYRVRFGEGHLDNSEIEAVEQALTDLERVLAAKPTPHAPVA